MKTGTDVAFECNAKPSTSRSLPIRSCKKAMVNYDDDSSSSDDIYNYPENDDADTNFKETEQPNLVESMKNLFQNEENVHTNMEDSNSATDSNTIPSYAYDEDEQFMVKDYGKEE